MPIRLALACAALAALLAAPAARADADCRPVYGHFSSGPAPTCDSPVGFCTAGRLIGGIQASYSFSMTTEQPAPPPNPPGVVFYTGQSTVTLDRGGAILLSDAGAISFTLGKMAALLTVTGGTGAAAGATGYLQLHGSLDLATGTVTGDYVGEICTP